MATSTAPWLMQQQQQQQSQAAAAWFAFANTALMEKGGPRRRSTLAVVNKVMSTHGTSQQ